MTILLGTLGFIAQIGQLGQYRACASQVNPSTSDYPELLDVWEDSFRCSYNASDTIPLCPESVDDRLFECRCRGDENFATLPIDVKLVVIIISNSCLAFG